MGDRKKITKIDPSKISEYERVRRDFVRLEYDEKTMREKFKLSPRLCDFAREYALTGDVLTSAIFAGYSRNTALKKQKQLCSKCSAAVYEIRAALLEIGNGFKASLREHLTAAMLDIVDNRKEAPAPAVMACKMLAEMYRLDDFSYRKEQDEDVSDAEIERSLRRFTVLEKGDDSQPKKSAS